QLLRQPGMQLRPFVAQLQHVAQSGDLAPLAARAFPYFRRFGESRAHRRRAGVIAIVDEQRLAALCRDFQGPPAPVPLARSRHPPTSPCHRPAPSHPSPPASEETPSPNACPPPAACN